MEKIDVKVKELYKQDFQNLQSSQLILEISGKSVNNVVVNTLRRLVIDYIPTYGFASELLKIEANTSIFNNDMMKLRLSQITIPKINVPIAYLENKYWKGIEFSNPDREKHPDDTKLLEFYVTMKNNTTDNLNVTTNDAKVFLDGNELKNKFDKKYPCLLIQLRPSEQFSARCVAALSIGKNNNIFAAAANAYIDEISETSCKLTVESQGQISEYESLHKGCTILIQKLETVKSLILEQYDTPEIRNKQELKLVLENEDHMLGGILNDSLQNNRNIVFSGVSKPNLLIDTMVIKMKSMTKNPLKPLIESIDYIIKLYTEIGKQIYNAGKKFIEYKPK